MDRKARGMPNMISKSLRTSKIRLWLVWTITCPSVVTGPHNTFEQGNPIRTLWSWPATNTSGNFLTKRAGIAWIRTPVTRIIVGTNCFVEVLMTWMDRRTPHLFAEQKVFLRFLNVVSAQSFLKKFVWRRNFGLFKTEITVRFFSQYCLLGIFIQRTRRHKAYQQNNSQDTAEHIG